VVALRPRRVAVPLAGVKERAFASGVETDSRKLGRPGRRPKQQEEQQRTLNRSDISGSQSSLKRRAPGRNKYAHLSKKDFDADPAQVVVSRILAVDSVRNTKKGGRTNRFRALVVAGNGNGALGFATGKSRNVRDAINKAATRAKMQSRWVPINLAPDKGLYHDVMGKKNNTLVLLRSTRPYAGLTANPVIQGLCLCAGIESAVTKVIGRTTTSSVVYAFFDALAKHRSPQEIAMFSGKKVKLCTRWRRDRVGA